LKLETMPADCATVRTTIKSPLCHWDGGQHNHGTQLFSCNTDDSSC